VTSRSRRPVRPSLTSTKVDADSPGGPIASPPVAIALRPVELVVLQSTPFCNIDCSYCYLGHRDATARMSVATLEAVERFLAPVPFAQDPVSVVWHAGEPLASPIAFYEEAFRALGDGPHGLRLRHHFQTNGTLLTDDWCALIKAWSVRIGVSLDGPREVHDRHRRDRSGRGTFDRTLSGVRRLQAHGIPFSVLAVVTKETLAHREDVCSFFESLGITALSVNFEQHEGVHDHSSLSGPQYEAGVRHLVDDLIDLQGRQPQLRIRELDRMRRCLRAPADTAVPNANNLAGSIVNVDVAGHFTTFSPELLGQTDRRYGAFRWGNVHTDTWSSLPDRDRFRAAHDDIAAGVDACRRSCGYFSVCGGGSPSNKLSEHGSFASTETLYCRLHVKTVADAMMESLEREAASGDALRKPGHISRV
jgi:uncharacterized protein